MRGKFDQETRERLSACNTSYFGISIDCKGRYVGQLSEAEASHIGFLGNHVAIFASAPPFCWGGDVLAREGVLYHHMDFSVE